MRVLKAIFVGLGLLLGLLLVAIGAFFIYLSIDREDTFIVEQTTLADSQYLQHFAAMSEEARRNAGRTEFHAAAHRLKRGDGTVLAYRRYSNGSPILIDDEWYRKVSILLSHPLTAQTVTFNLAKGPEALIVFSEGGSAWPEAGCSGYGVSGTVRVSQKGSRYVVEIVADVQTSNPLRPEKCGPEHLELSFEAERIRYEDLTPWLGCRGEHPYHETYRRTELCASLDGPRPTGLEHPGSDPRNILK